jgi:hypothetical protein
VTVAEARPGSGGTTRRTLLWGAGVAAAVGAAVALPFWLGGSATIDPAADAEAAYRELLVRIDARGTAPEPAGPPAEPVPAGSRRNLFSPAVERRPAVALPQARRKEPSLPALSSILIDGASRHAVLDGRVVGVGELVGGFRIAAIEPDAVVLRDGASAHRLTVGGDR